MHLTYVTPRYPPHTGGVETHVEELATRAAAAGHDVTVHTADLTDTLPRTEQREGVSVVRHRSIGPKETIHFAPGVARALRKEGPDLVHAHNAHSLPLGMAALVVDCPLVVTPHYHGASADSFRDHLLNLYQPLLGSAVRRADAVIAVSEWERRQLAADFGVDASVIPNGVDVERFSSATPDTRDTPYLLCVGRVEEYKGIQHVIRSLPKHDYDLVVAGSGPYLAELRSLAADLGVVDRVSFEGYVDDERLPRLYAGAAAYVTMSEFEAYGMTVAEALAAGTPCVVREAGALVDWADRTDCVGVGTDALVEGISTAVNLEAPTDPLPTWDRVYDRIEAIYGSVK